MDRPSLFLCDSYKMAMAQYLAGKGNRGQLSRAADALGCQRSYLSRVISDSLHLTPEHAFHLAEFLKFSRDERDYFLALVERDRAAGPRYRKHWDDLLLNLRKKHESIQDRANRTSFALEPIQAHYFTSWTWAAIHFLTALPAFQTAEAIAERLHFDKDFVRLHLDELNARGLVKQEGTKWKFQSGEFHAPTDSPLVILHHQNWRLRAVQDSQDLSRQNPHFTGVLTLSRKDLARVKALLLDFIAEANRIAAPSPPEECIALLCDLFAV